MCRKLLALAALTLASAALAQTPAPPRFAFAPGQTLTYSVTQTTTVTETTLDDKTRQASVGMTSTKLDLTRQWAVKGVDAKGATLEMSITAMKQAINRPGPAGADGKPTVDRLVMDSATPEGKEQMAAFLGKPIVTVTVDGRGQVVDAKGENAASVERLRAELPFRVTLPEALPAVGGTWARSFTVKLDPPHGTGDKYELTQTYTHAGEREGHLVVGVATALKVEPKDAGEMPGLVPYLWSGEAYFHPATGRYAGARLSVKQTVANHQGAGSQFAYETSYVEALK